MGFFNKPIDNITALHNRIITNENGVMIGYVNYVCGVASYVEKDNDGEKVTYGWSATLNVGYGARLITLHNPPGDTGLKNFEEKIWKLAGLVAKFIELVTQRKKKEAGEIVTRREWLSEHGSDPEVHSSYVAFSVEKDGEGYFRLADCDRSLVMYVNQDSPTLRYLEELGEALKKLLVSLEATRNKFEQKTTGDSK